MTAPDVLIAPPCATMRFTVSNSCDVSNSQSCLPSAAETAYSLPFDPPWNTTPGMTVGAAPTVIPGVVFQGGSNGRLYAVSAADGKQLWEFDTSQEFETVNRMVAHGGAISTSGAVIVDGMVYVGSGYAVGTGATAGNVLLAFGIE